jgi:hypothetical protein
MGYKYVKLDENGKKVTTHQYDEGAVSYATRKYKDSLLGEHITRTITYSSIKNNRTNRFDIYQSRVQGLFIVSWENVHIAPRPSETKDGVITLDYRVDFIINVKLGEFERLQDAELYAIKFALDFGDVKSFYGYHPLFEKENITIEDIPTVFTWDGGSRPIQIKCPTVDKKVIEENKEKAKRRLLSKQNGEEDTRIMVKVLLNVDLNAIQESIQSHLESEVSTVENVGADGDSVYNVDEVDVLVKSTGEIEATFYLERESGKFASTDDLRSEIVNQLGSSNSVEIPIEVTE